MNVDREQALLARIAELEEEVRILKRTLAPQGIGVPAEWRLTGGEESLVLALCHRDVLSKEACMTALHRPSWDRDGWPSEKIVDVFICKLRKKLSPFGCEIETVWGRGYKISDATKALINGSGAP